MPWGFVVVKTLCVTLLCCRNNDTGYSKLQQSVYNLTQIHYQAAVLHLHLRMKKGAGAFCLNAHNRLILFKF